ncbi:type II and III secretion system protein family protein [Paraburkholderia sp. GAS348]|uniref:type II and III secretion system protein family protein n=1 Tax=Paraburkholderia sp. GAS348 TaxID=3035132 RepID=UPI003D22900F
MTTKLSPGLSPGGIGLKLTACAVISGASALAVYGEEAPVRAALPPGPDPTVADRPLRSQGALAVDAGKGTLVRLGENATAVFVADPTIADVHVPSPKVVFVLGKKAGTTTLYVLGADNKTLLQRTVVVGRDMDSLRSAIAARFPNLHVKLTASPGSLLVSGEAPSAADADAVVQTISPYLADKEVLVNRITIDRPLQVQLRVRITEVDRNVTEQLGINWASVGSTVGQFSAAAVFGFGTVQRGRGTSIQAMVDALSQEGLLTVLAEPNLVALSGQTASFLAGGEFPIPIAQTNNGSVTVEFKQFGVKLDFTPTVINEHRISLKVRPEVSQIDTTASVTTNGITVPGLSVRRADTTVELASGQSFAIGGLLQTNTTDIVSQVPGLGSIPILGKLFSSTNYLNNKTELVIIVTPYLVEPTDPARLRTPLDSLMSPSSDVEYSFRHESGEASTPSGQPRLVGAAGYVY